jgi:PAS domain S-box-containing protein
MEQRSFAARIRDIVMLGQSDQSIPMPVLLAVTSPTAIHAAPLDILICARTPTLAASLLALLGQAGYQAQAVAPYDLPAAILAAPPAVLLLDLAMLRAADAEDTAVTAQTATCPPIARTLNHLAQMTRDNGIIAPNILLLGCENTASLADVQQALAWGADDYLPLAAPAPHDPDISPNAPMLLLRIEAAIQRWQRIRQADTERSFLNWERNRLVTLLAETQDAIVEVDLNGIVQTWNRGAERLYGIPASQAIGAFHPGVPRDRRIELRQLLLHARAGDSEEVFQTQRLYKGDTTVHVLLSTTPVRDAQGHVVSMLEVAKDVTAIRQQEQELRRQNERLRVVHEVTDALIQGGGPAELADRVLQQIMKSLDLAAGAVFLFDQECQDLALIAQRGYRPERALVPWEQFERQHAMPDSPTLAARVAHTRAGLIVEQDSNGERTMLPDIEAEEPGGAVVVRPLHAQERLIGVLQVTMRVPRIISPPFFSRSNIPFGKRELATLYIVSDLFALALQNAKLLDDLRAAYERQRELDRLKDQFLLNANHELRTPLAAIQGYVELLSEHSDKLSDEQAQIFLNKARHGCEELELLLANIMDAGRIDADISRMILVPVRLEEAVMSVLDLINPYERSDLGIKGGRAFNVAVPPGCTVLTDELRLRQVLLNLISNAVKYSPSGSPVTIAAQVIADQFALDEASSSRPIVDVAVIDQGPGIPFEDQPRLFGKFVRLDRDLGGRIPGTGLGLYVSHRILEAMGQRIWIESAGVPGAGAAFHFTLPLASPSPHAP